MQKLYQYIEKSRKSGKRLFALLLDPEKENSETLSLISDRKIFPDFIFVGGSQLTSSVEVFVSNLRQYVDIPVVIFPGNFMQPAKNADAMLFLSLISGRNPEFLIEQQIKAAPIVSKFQMEILPTGYILIDGECDTAVKRVSRTAPYPTDDITLIVNTALAGELLGMKLIYLEAGSGAKIPVPHNVIAEVRASLSLPLIVGGGLKSTSDITNALVAGADIIVVGNHIENNPSDLPLFIETVKNFNNSINKAKG